MLNLHKNVNAIAVTIKLLINDLAKLVQCL